MNEKEFEDIDTLIEDVQIIDSILNDIRLAVIKIMERERRYKLEIERLKIENEVINSIWEEATR